MAQTVERRVTNTTATVLPAAETVVATLQIPSTSIGYSIVNLDGQLTLTTAGSTTGVTLRIRRTSLTGALVGVAAVDGIFAAAAGGEETHNISVQDQPGDTAGQVYVLTAQSVGAVGNGAAVQACLSAVLSGS